MMPNTTIATIAPMSRMGHVAATVATAAAQAAAAQAMKALTNTIAMTTATPSSTLLIASIAVEFLLTASAMFSNQVITGPTALTICVRIGKSAVPILMSSASIAALA